MKTIWIVKGCTAYEDSIVIRAFLSEADAEIFAENLKFSDDKKRERIKKFDWEKFEHSTTMRYPPSADYDYYYVLPIKFDDGGLFEEHQSLRAELAKFRECEDGDCVADYAHEGWKIYHKEGK